MICMKNRAFLRLILFYYDDVGMNIEKVENGGYLFWI